MELRASQDNRDLKKIYKRKFNQECVSIIQQVELRNEKVPLIKEWPNYLMWYIAMKCHTHSNIKTLSSSRKQKRNRENDVELNVLKVQKTN